MAKFGIPCSICTNPGDFGDHYAAANIKEILINYLSFGTGGRNQTFAKRVKVSCAIITQHPNKFGWGGKSRTYMSITDADFKDQCG